MSGDHNQYQKPDYIDRRQWKYDPLTGEPLIDGWPLYSGLPEPEPVGWIYEDDEGRMMFTQMPHPDPLWEPVYRAKKQWQGLTAKDLAEIPPSCYEGAIWADAKLKERNG